jgi:hypothetical protein
MANLVISPTRRFWVLAGLLAGVLLAAPMCFAQGGDEGGGGWGKKPATKAPETKPKPAATTPAPAPTTTTTAGDKDSLKEEGKKLFGQPGVTAASGESGAKGWAVVIAAFKGDGNEQNAATMLDKIRKEGGLPEAYVAKRNEAIIIAVGDYPTPDDDRAKKELTRIQTMEVGREGMKPYASAMLAPPLDWKMVGNMPQFNLAKAKETYGAGALYTLQVGVYERGDIAHPREADLKEVRKAAEEAAAKLRGEGELAFYFHGPTMSMVTVGVFDTSDFDPQIPGYNSPRLREVKKRNPYNLDNGKGIKVKLKGQKEAQLQPSGLVEIPKG